MKVEKIETQKKGGLEWVKNKDFYTKKGNSEQAFDFSFTYLQQ
jgi:hypothetical protein